ncbi:hypothetical protein FACS1894132_03070 [Clostridia bacterium]|nr:hypothetical protein FACS1894132_03070 [Clostridia bacterium]
MKKKSSVPLTFLAVGFIIVMSLYSLGVIDMGGVTTVTEKKYSDFTYTGEIKGGDFDGKGDITFADGSRYVGDFSGGRFNGKGIFYATDWRYEGTFKNGEMTGQGVVYANGDTLTKSADGVMEFISKQNWSYLGGLNARGQTGVGLFTFSDGTIYEGDFALGLAEGMGSYTSETGEKIYVGGFKNGLFDGRGDYTGETFSYKGDFSNGVYEGVGELSENGKMQYSGDFVNGQPDGKGIYYSPDDWIYEGSFKKGVFNGDGKIIKANGEVTVGVWEDGKLVNNR